MNLSFEALFVIGVIGFYLYDSSMLLFSNELIFTAKRRKWAFTSAESHWQMLGKNLYIPNPFTPSSVMFRVSWFITGSEQPPEDQHRLNNFILALTPLRWMTYYLFALLIVVLPLIMLGYGAGLEFLIVVAAVYLTITVMLVLVWRQKEVLGLSKKTFAKLSFDSLACAPFALNLLRKITLQRSLSGDPIIFAREHFDTATFSQLIQNLARRIDAQIAYEDVDSTRQRSLLDYRNTIMSMLP